MTQMRASSSAALRALIRSRRTHPVLSPSRSGSCVLSSRFHEICLRSRCTSILRKADRAAKLRCDPRFGIESPTGTTRPIDHVPKAIGDFLQLRAAGPKNAARQPIAAELFQPVLPALRATAQIPEDPGQLRRDRGLSLAEEPTGVVDQPDIAPHGGTAQTPKKPGTWAGMPGARRTVTPRPGRRKPGGCAER